MHENEPEFHRKMIMSDEAHFHLGGYVNKQNCQNVTVWCSFWAGGIIRPHFFENEAGAAVSVNVLHYWTMINEFLCPELEDMDVDDVYF